MSQQKEYSKKRFNYLDDTELEEILACMEDSDRYINEDNKNNIIRDIKIELHYRGFTHF